MGDSNWGQVVVVEEEEMGDCNLREEALGVQEAEVQGFELESCHLRSCCRFCIDLLFVSKLSDSLILEWVCIQNWDLHICRHI